MSFSYNKRNKNRNLNNSYGSSTINKQPRSKNVSRIPSNENNQVHQAEGVYSNCRLMHATTSLVGTLANVLVKDGSVYEGVFKTFSSEFEVVLHMVSENVPNAKSSNVSSNIGTLLASLSSKNKVHETIIFKWEDIVMLTVPNVDLEFASRGNFTDTEISKFNSNDLIKEKDLVPWDAPANDNNEIIEKDILLEDNDGWDANDMFKLNEKKYNVASTYTDSLEGYTVPLIKKDTEEYKQKEAEAFRIAQLIENDSASKDRLAKEDGDEEDKFSAVKRPANENLVTNENNYNVQHSKHNSSSNIVSLNRRKQSPGNVLGNNLRMKNVISNQYNSGNVQQSSFHHYNSISQSHNEARQNSGPPIHNNQRINNLRGDNSRDKSHHNFINNSPNNSYSKMVDSQNYHDERDHHRVYSQHDQHHVNNLGQNNFQSQMHSLPQRNHNVENRRVNFSISKKRDDVVHDFKKFSSDFKLAPVSSTSTDSSNNKENIKEIQSKETQKTTTKANTTISENTNEIAIKNDNHKEKVINKENVEKNENSKTSKESDNITISNTNSKTKSNETVKTTDINSISSDSNLNENIKETKRSNIQADSNKSSVVGNEVSTEASLTEAEKIAKKSNLNPNAKEFVLNPTAKPFTPKFATYSVPIANNPAIPYSQHHIIQPQIHQVQINQIPGVPHSNQQVVPPTVMHHQQPIVSAHHSHHAAHHQVQMQNQIVPFATQFVPQSIQFAVAGHPQNVHHAQHNHHPSHYISLPTVTNTVSAPHLPSNNQTAGNLLNYQTNNHQQSGTRRINKSVQFHSSNSVNSNQRPSQQPQQLQQPREFSQNVVPAPGIPVLASVGAYSQQAVSAGVSHAHAGTTPSHSVYSAIYPFPQPHHPTRLMSPQSLSMVPGMTYTGPDSTTMQQLYMTNMTMSQFVTVTQQPQSTSSTPTLYPAPTPSPVSQQAQQQSRNNQSNNSQQQHQTPVAQTQQSMMFTNVQPTTGINNSITYIISPSSINFTSPSSSSNTQQVNSSIPLPQNHGIQLNTPHYINNS